LSVGRHFTIGIGEATIVEFGEVLVEEIGIVDENYLDREQGGQEWMKEIVLLIQR
jgi:hypothetical protein